MLQEEYGVRRYTITQNESGGKCWFLINKKELRCSIALDTYLNTIDIPDEEIKVDYQPEYNFGVQFTYWENKNGVSCKAKHKDLKKEICEKDISMSEWNDVCKKAKMLLAQKAQKIAFAKYIPHLNECCGIKYGATMKWNHVVAILLCNDSVPLLSKAKTICIRKKEETISDVKRKHSEYVNWFRLLVEAIIFYGSNLSRNDDTVYHILTKTAYFSS
eukprot:206775_1